jgi:cell cycle serine/threonine-protein kinase CDC5/MSD2
MPDPQEHPSLHDIVDHAFFTRGIVPCYIPISARDIPPDFQHISPLVSQSNTSCFRQACQLDGDAAPPPEYDNEPPTPSASSASSFAQQEREFQKAAQPGSSIFALLSSARQPLMVAPGGISAARREPTSYTNYKPRRRKQQRTSRPPRRSRLPVDCRASRRSAGTKSKGRSCG